MCAGRARVRSRIVQGKRGFDSIANQQRHRHRNGCTDIDPSSIMASRAVVGGIVDARAVGTKKEEEEENARGGGEGIDPGLVDELYESLRDAVRGLI